MFVYGRRADQMTKQYNDAGYNRKQLSHSVLPTSWSGAWYLSIHIIYTNFDLNVGVAILVPK